MPTLLESLCVCGVGGCVGGRHGVLTLLERILILDPLQLHCTEVILDDSALSPSSSRLQCSLASLQSTISHCKYLIRGPYCGKE